MGADFPLTDDELALVDQHRAATQPSGPPSIQPRAHQVRTRADLEAAQSWQHEQEHGPTPDEPYPRHWGYLPE
ncbi:hypothetical protein ACLQ3K_16120 [Tsukamurella sp. DT100]|uniref:hypothetical protein n=1 Tax=Tsukamurella sp. DT100 TaxID=3393415 RepID=UPI003CEBB0CA